MWPCAASATFAGQPASWRLVAVLLLVSFSRTARSGIFDAFPRVDERQLAVYEADILQFVGTADSGKLVAALRNASDTRWQPLLTVDSSGTPRALLSVGVADFRNTSSGAYRELVIAFPACEATEPLQLECRGFTACQSQLPDCAHTYMFQSFGSDEAAIQASRSFGIDANLADSFTFEAQGIAKETVLIQVHGPDGTEVLGGTVETAPSGSAPGGGAPGGAEADGPADYPVAAAESQQRPAKDGYNLHPYVGIPGVLGPGQARYLCAFSGQVDVLPVRVAGSLSAGDLLESFDVKFEGAFYLPRVNLVQMPPWGYQDSASQQGHKLQSRPIPSGNKAPSIRQSGTGRQKAPPAVSDALKSFFGVPTSEDDPPRIKIPADPENTGPAAFPWELQDRPAQTTTLPQGPPAMAQRTRKVQGPTAAGAFPWHLSEI